MRKDTAPLYEKMVQQHNRNTANFHVPGHKGGKGLNAAGVPFFADAMALDYTEFSDLDDLHQPDGVIREAQVLAADCFGAEETFFLVGGSTAGNLAMILTVCGPGDLLLVQRNAHKSVLHGLMLAGARAVFLPPRWDEASGLAAGVRAGDVKEALRRYPEAKGVFVTNPNYYGMGIDLMPVAQAAHEAGVPLLVDEAHGAHYGFHPDLPASALSCGADAVVQSTHKTLTAMTMGAMLHTQGSRIHRDTLKQRLTMVQSSSPSYPIMASLDLCRLSLHVEGGSLLDPGLQAASAMRVAIHELPHFGMVHYQSGVSKYDTLDPYKISLYDNTQTLSGYRLQQELAQEGCAAEMADPSYVLLALGPGTCMEDAERLKNALLNISRRFSLKKQEMRQDASNRVSNPLLSVISSSVSFLLQPYNGTSCSVDLPHAAGLRSAEMVIPYPPGIPVLYPGETITEQAQAYLMRLAESGARFQGVYDTTLASIRVYQDTANVPEST